MSDFMVLIIMTYQIFCSYNIKLMRKEEKAVSFS
jgi:hypothetical protein